MEVKPTEVAIVHVRLSVSTWISRPLILSTVSL